MRRISSGNWAFIQAFVWTPLSTLAALTLADWWTALEFAGRALSALVWFYVTMVPTIYAVWVVPALDARDAAKSPEIK